MCSLSWLEVRNYRDAPRHFQHLAFELQQSQRVLQRLLQMEPDNEERERLEHIRIIAIHCSQPLETFPRKMRLSEGALGYMRSAGTLSTLGKRLHWSLVTRADVDELRAAITSEMVAITMLMGIEQAWVRAHVVPLS